MTYRPYIWIGEEQDAHVEDWVRLTEFWTNYREMREDFGRPTDRTKSLVVSRPGSAITVKQLMLTRKEMAELSVNVRLSDI